LPLIPHLPERDVERVVVGLEFGDATLKRDDLVTYVLTLRCALALFRRSERAGSGADDRQRVREAAEDGVEVRTPPRASLAAIPFAVALPGGD